MVCSKFWKLDKIDKIFIALTFIVVTMFSFFNCFCYASFDTVLRPVLVSNLRLEIDGDNVVTLEEERYYDIYEIPSYYGYNYNFVYSQPSSLSNEISFKLIAFDDIPNEPGVTGTILISSSISPGDTISYDYNLSTKNKIYLCISSNGDGRVTFLDNLIVTTDYVPNGFGDSINLLVENVSFSALWSTFEKSVSYVLIVVVVAFGIYLITRMIKGLSKGKGRL